MSLTMHSYGNRFPDEQPSMAVQIIRSDLESALVEGLSDPVSASSADAGWADFPYLSLPATTPVRPSARTGEPTNHEADTDFESVLLGALSDARSVSSEEADTLVLRLGDEFLTQLEDPPAGMATDFEDALLAGLSGEAAISPEHGSDPEPSDPRVSLGPLLANGPELNLQTFGADVQSDNTLEEGLLDSLFADSGDLLPDLSPVSLTVDATSELVSDGAQPDPWDLPALDVADGEPHFSVAPHGPVAALAFAADPETETALREGLMHFEGASPDHEDPQVWPGGLRAAVAALGDGALTDLVVVDIDGTPYPAGSMHELAEVCEVGTAVIAIGSDGSARASREILLAGVSDYLVKPIVPTAIREAALRATEAERKFRRWGCVAGFTGTGGSGATTLAVATALHAAGQGRYVSILDLNRTVSSVALLLDVEPAPGLDQLLDVAGNSLPDPKLLDGVRAERSERISVYAYRTGSTLPPVPSMPALDWLVGQLRRRSQLVLVDGLDDPETYFDLLGEVDVRVFVVEPTAAGAARAARTLGLLGRAAPVLLVQNHTRAFRIVAGSRMLKKAGVAAPVDAVVPFDRSLPEVASHGWPRGRLPRHLRKPVAALAGRLSLPEHGASAAFAVGA